MKAVTFTPVESIVFWVAAIMAVVGGIGVVTARGAIYSALSLIVTLSQLAVLYLILNAQFIAAAQILIYAGAVMVLFLFVITLLGVQDYPFIGERLRFQRALAVLFGAVLLVCLIFFVGQSATTTLTGAHGTFNAQLDQGNVQAFGTQLFTTFVFPFEMTALVLIVAMVGAVAVGRRRRDTPEPTAPTAEPVLGPESEAPAREPEQVDV